jgi:hypothetical protein
MTTLPLCAPVLVRCRAASSGDIPIHGVIIQIKFESRFNGRDESKVNGSMATFR